MSHVRGLRYAAGRAPCAAAAHDRDPGSLQARGPIDRSWRLQATGAVRRSASQPAAGRSPARSRTWNGFGCGDQCPSRSTHCPGIEIDNQRPLANGSKRGAQVYGGRGFADPALLIGNGDDPGRRRIRNTACKCLFRRRELPEMACFRSPLVLARLSEVTLQANRCNVIAVCAANHEQRRCVRQDPCDFSPSSRASPIIPRLASVRLPRFGLWGKARRLLFAASGENTNPTRTPAARRRARTRHPRALLSEPLRERSERRPAHR